MADAFQIFFPCAELKPFVRYYSTYQTSAEKQHLALYAILPMTLPALNFLSTEQAFFIATVTGPLCPVNQPLSSGRCHKQFMDNFAVTLRAYWWCLHHGDCTGFLD